MDDYRQADFIENFEGARAFGSRVAGAADRIALHGSRDVEDISAGTIGYRNRTFEFGIRGAGLGCTCRRRM